jgi:TP901 family phage tail tape measure protein
MNEAVAIEMAIRARNQMSGPINNMIRKVQQMKKQFASFARSMVSYGKKIAAAVAKMHAAIMKLRNALRTVRDVALKAFTALVALTGIPIYKFAKFEQAMANVNTLVDTSAKKFRELQDGVVSVSNRVGESAESLSTALYDIVSAGVDAGNSIGVLDLSARAAAAGMTDAQTAVNAGISTINAYNLEISKLNKVFDLQFQTVRKGVITYEELSSAQGELLPSARKLNESLENMYGSLAFVTKNGLSAESASTSLARAYDGLIQKSNELAQAGVEVYDEFGEFRGIIDIVEDLSDKLEGLSDKEMQDVLQGIGFEVRAARAIIPMVNNIDGLKESVEAMGDSAGSMQAAFEEATDTIQFRFNRAKERIVNSMIAIGRTFRTEVNSMLDNVGAWALAIQGFVSQNREAIKSMLTFALKLTGVIAVFASVGVAIMGLMTPIGAVSAAIALFGGLWYLNMWDIRDKTDKAISKIIELWGSLQESTKNTVDYSLKQWNKFKNWWQDTTWIEKVQDIGKIALNVGGWAWENTGEPIVQSLWNWIKDKFDKNDDEKITFDEVLEVAIDVTVGGFNAVGDIANKLNNWVQQNLFPSDGSIEEQIEREMGNSGIGELLKAVYRAEGGKDASALYGTTWFKENGHKFGKQANQEFFEGLVSSMGIEKDSQGWYAASSATTINHYWDNFKDNYELAADQTLASLSDEMQDKFIKYLGSNYSPTKGILTPAEEKLNKNWIPNVSEFYNSEMLNQISASDIKESVTSKINLTPIFEVTLEGANTAIEAIADFLGWIHEEGIAYNIGNILAKIALGIAEFKLKTIAKIITDVLDIDLEKGEMAANIGKLTINVLKVGWNFMQGVSDGFWEKLTGKTSAELGQDTNNWIDLNLDGNADKVKPHMATGGYISGAGTSTSDSIPAMLSNGEYVINAASTSKWRPILEAINSGNFSGFRPGGPVGQSSYVPPDVANEWALKAAGIEGDFSSKMLNALTGIAKDTKNFQHVVDLVSGIENMKKAFQETLDNNESDLQDAIDQLEEDLKNLENEGEKFNANLSNLTSELSSFANNIANVTGNETAGLVGSLIGSGKGMYDQYQNFKKSDDFMSQMTSGFGMANAALGAIGAFKSWNDSRNEKAQQYWQEQLELDKEQLDNIKQIESNTKETTANLVKYLSQNPTNSNIAGGKSVLDDVYNRAS